MTRTCVTFLVLCLLSWFTAIAQTSRRDALAEYGRLPLAFEENRGQVDTRARFLTRGSGYSMFLTGEESVLRLGVRHGTVLRTRLAGALPATVRAESPLPGRVNYLIDRDPKKWVTDVPTFARVRYAGVYRGIDLLYYGKQGRLEYDFVVAPGADARQIRMQVRGADKLLVQHDGSLVIESGGMKVKWAKPVAYQTSALTSQSSAKTPVRAAYRVHGDEIAFDVGPYDPTRALVIDPALVYSTYLGGPFAEQDQSQRANSRGRAVAVDGSGNAYLTGSTNAVDFPVTAGAFDTDAGVCRGGPCILGFVSKLNAGGTALVYSTYFATETWPGDIAVDGNGRAYVVGNVSPGISSVPLTASAFQGSPGCEGGEATFVFLSVLNRAGNGLAYSTLYGTTGGCDGTNAFDPHVAVGSTGVAYVAGATDTPDLTTRSAYQPTFHGGQDAFLAKFDPSRSGSASLLYASYLGGSGFEGAVDVATESGRVYLVGSTNSANFPTTTAAYRRTLLGTDDLFVAKIDTNQAGAASLAWSTLLGGSSADVVTGIALLGSNPYLTGYTASADFPTTTGVAQRAKTGPAVCQETDRNCYDAFVTKLASSGSSLSYSTFLGGGTGSDFANGISVDGSGRAWVVGHTYASDFPVTSNALQRTYHAGICDSTANVPCVDAFLTGISPAAATRVYSTYFGGGQNDVANAIAVRSGFAYLTGWTGSTDLPTTAGAVQRTLKGTEDAFVAKFSTASSLACSEPLTARTIHICSPVDGSTVSSPVRVTATAKAGSTAIRMMQVYVDGSKKYELSNTSRIDASLSMPVGTHRVTVQAIDGSGAFKATVYVTVQ